MAKHSDIDPPPLKVPKAGVITAKDKKYCSKCFYRGARNEGYLCNFYLITGERRGCRAGEGCKRRELTSKYEDGLINRICETCGEAYKGTPNSHYCLKCKQEMIRKANISRAQLRSVFKSTE